MVMFRWRRWAVSSEARNCGGYADHNHELHNSFLSLISVAPRIRMITVHVISMAFCEVVYAGDDYILMESNCRVFVLCIQ